MREAAPPTPIVPPGLVQSVQQQRVVLFLGAGASMEAKNLGKSPPTASQLRDALGNHFFGNPMHSHELMSLAELAIQEHGESIVFEFIKSLLEKFDDSDAHKLLPAFRWRTIATTNYDLLIDNAYAMRRDRLQTLVPFVKDREPVEERLRRVSSPLPYLKLHGCLNHLHDAEIPLILSHEHYSRYNKHRKKLYDRLEALATESTFVFCGYRLGDPHIRNIIYKLSPDETKRPAYYLIAPNISPYDIKFWATKNVHVIETTFGEFMNALDVAIPTIKRALVIPAAAQGNAIVRHFKTNEDLPENTALALLNDVVHVHSEMPIEAQDPKRFYAGFDTGWGAMFQRLDVIRTPVEDLLLDAVLDAPNGPEPQFFVFTGPAGSGKTIALKRAAWEAAATYNAIALWHRPTGALSFELIRELYRLTGKRIYIFVDRLALYAKSVEKLFGEIKQAKIAATFVAAERLNEWNVYCERLEELTAASELPIQNLTPGEIEKLLDLLTRHGALGSLDGKSRDEQIKAFSERAERQLLVALHEVTRGMPFEQIVHEEYLRIVPQRAQQLYLDICTMHQFGVPVRAGTISRASGVQFGEYQRDFLEPLEDVVMVVQDAYTGDFQYKARHTRVAELVFQHACPQDETRVTQLVRLIESLDIGFSVDRKAMETIIHARSLIPSILDVESGRRIYKAALEAAPDTGFTFHQWAIFELNHPGGSIVEAESFIKLAAELEPRSKSIKHTHAEICRRQANEAETSLLKDQYRRLARERLDEMNMDRDSYVMVTRCKLIIDEIRDAASALQDAPQPSELGNLQTRIKDAERLLARALQFHPDDPEVLKAEASLQGVLEQHTKAVTALERAWAAKPKGSGVAISLAHHYSNQNDPERAKSILESALERDPNDRSAHLEMAKYLIQNETNRVELIQQHLASSYAPNDHNHEARHLYAQYLFLTGKPAEAAKVFAIIDRTAPAEFRRRTPKSDSLISARLQRYFGTVVTMRPTMAFLQCGAYTSDIFAHVNDSSAEVWRSLRAGDGVTFKMRFNRAGPVALDLQHRNS